jgi:integrase
MAKQRGHGEGSIYQRKDGRWAASITLENRKRKTFYGKTRKEVQEKLKVALHEQQQGTLVTEPHQTLNQFLEHWLEEVHKLTIRPRTYTRYRELIALHILPVLGQFQLQKLTPQHIQSFYAQKSKEGLSASVVNGMHAILHKALDKAVQWNLIARNVCDSVSPPRRQRHEVQPLTVKQSQQFLVSAKGHRFEALYVLALATGMRRGELLALKWQDINLADRTLQVRRTVSAVRGEGLVEAEPKTARSRRSIVLLPIAIEVLKRHQVTQVEAKRKAGSRWIERDLVFCTSNGYYFNDRAILYPFKRFLQEAELPVIRFHDLRHSAATLLLGMGIHPKVVQEMLGHSQISITMDIYSHVMPTMQRDAAEKLNTLLQTDGS